MILQALKEYYDRKAADPGGDIAPEGWEWREIPFVVVLSLDGEPVYLENTQEGSGRNRRAKLFLVPRVVKKSVNILANLFWGNIEYTLGVVQKGKPPRVAEQHKAFKNTLSTLGIVEDDGFTALTAFLNKNDKAQRLENLSPQSWDELIKQPGANITFRLVSDSEIIVRRPAVVRAIDNLRIRENKGSAVCLVTGKKEQNVETLHPAIKGVWGTQSSGANIVSFNLDAFTSYCKKQGANAPIGKFAAFAYTTALNHLLGRDSKQKLQVADATTIFWSAKRSSFEEDAFFFFSEPPKDDPDCNTQAVKALYDSIWNGTYIIPDDETRFYVLGLSPNAARIAVRFWHVGTVREMGQRFKQHVDDLSITHGVKEDSALPIRKLLHAIALQGKDENIPPNLAGDTIRAILEGTPYPATLLQAAIRRNRAEQKVTYPRAAIIKATLNRSLRFNNPTKEKELTMSLDPENKNIGYRLGRLFAALEKVQLDAHRDLNATIRDRFYGAASSTPVTVFGNLLRLSQHHLGKLSGGLKVTRERQIQEIMSEIVDFPAHLNIADQGHFAVGYYHQMEDFFTPKRRTINHQITLQRKENDHE